MPLKARSSSKRLSALTQVIVQHNSLSYLCPWVRIETSLDAAIKCGRCLAGCIIPKKGYECRVCSSIVTQVEHGYHEYIGCEWMITPL